MLMSCTAEHHFGKSRIRLGQNSQIARRRPVASPLRGVLQDERNIATAQFISEHGEMNVV